MPTIVDVARAAGVSTAAVSLVINDPGTSRVGAPKKQAILRAARRLGYKPNSFARALISGNTRILGLVAPMRDPIFYNHFIAGVLSGIQRTLTERGYHLMVYSHMARSGHITRSQLLQSRYVDGVIFVNTRLCTESDIAATIADLGSENTPFVMVNSYYGRDPINYVGVDDRQIGCIGARYLLERGHRRIAVLGGARQNPMSPPFAEGFLAALREEKIAHPGALFAYGEYDREACAEATRRWVRMPRRPTAIFCADDQMVPDVYAALREEGMRVPGDMAVLGRGDFVFTSLLHPGLTTIRVPTVAMGEHAARLLVDTLEGKSRIAQRLLLPTELVVRESV